MCLQEYLSLEHVAKAQPALNYYPGGERVISSESVERTLVDGDMRRKEVRRTREISI